MKTKILFIFMLCLACFAFAEEDLSALLGGSVQSDRWLINRDKEEEEFIGNVSYSNEVYSLKADYALSQRKQNTYLLKGHITASQTLPDSFIQVKAEKFFYNHKTLKGYALGKTGKQVEGIYKTPNNTFTIFGDRIDFDKNKEQIKVSSYAELNDLNNTIYGDSITFNTQSGILEVFGKRPVLWGFGVDGDYALQADEMTADTQKGLFKAQGNVAGWITLASDFEKIKQVTSKK